MNQLRVKKHFLQKDDVIEIASFRIRYLVEPTVIHETGEERLLLALPLPVPQSIGPGLYNRIVRYNGSASTSDSARIQVISGANAGKELLMSKPPTTIGKAGEQVAVITKDADNFYLTYIEVIRGLRDGSKNSEATLKQRFSLTGERHVGSRAAKPASGPGCKGAQGSSHRCQ